MKTLRTGIVGSGKVAATHAAVLTALPESRFSAVFSRSREKGQAFAARFGARAFTDLGAFLRELDVAVVCTPHPFHAEPAVAACRAGVHVLVEKPLASSLADCDAMIGAARCGSAAIEAIACASNAPNSSAPMRPPT